MATILSDWSDQYQWVYGSFARLATLSVGEERRFRQLALEGLPIAPETSVLELYCGSGQTTQFLVERSRHGMGASQSCRNRAVPPK